MSHDHHDHMPGHDMPGHDMPTEAHCAMQMLWNTQIIDTCVVFPQWHIRSHFGFVVSFFIIVALGVGYEWLREYQRTVDRRVAQSLVGKGKGPVSLETDSPSEPAVGGSGEGREHVVLTGSSAFKAFSRTGGTRVPTHLRVLRAALYGATIFLSFFLMLVFMTYNAYLILAVVLGGATGHYVFGGTMDVDGVLYGGDSTKGMACH